MSTPQPSGQNETFVLLGEVTKAHGIRGELKIRPFTESPSNFIAYRRLYFALQPDAPLSVQVSLQGRINGSSVILRLEGCTTRNQADALVGAKIWLPSSDLPPAQGGEIYLYTLKGKKARMEDGQYLGTVDALLSTAGQDILVIRDGEKEYLIPAVRNFLVSMQDNELVLRLPPGLLEINR